MRLALSFVVPILLVVPAAFGTGCVHLLQPETYEAPERSERLQSDYLENELVRGLSEESFRRFYTRTGEWTDPDRPSVQETRAEDGFTVYRVGLGRAHAGDVYFREGRLDHWVGTYLQQESVVSVWRRPRIDPPEVGAGALARLERLDPGREPFVAPAPEELASAAACATATGTVLEILRPLTFDPSRRNRIDDRVLPGSSWPADQGILPAGTLLTIEPWNPVHDRRVRDDRGVDYEVPWSRGMDRVRSGSCPPGICARIGSSAVLTRELVLVTDDAGREARAIDPGRTRVPLWWVRAPLPAGSRVHVEWWAPCGRGAARIHLPDRPDLRGDIEVPWAPPGLFRPAGAEPNPAGAAMTAERARATHG